MAIGDVTGTFCGTIGGPPSWTVNDPIGTLDGE